MLQRLGLYFGMCLMASAAWGQHGDKFRQLDEVWPTPNSFRTASGAPGPDYWQQQVDYIIDVSLDEETHRVTGSETITYHNNSPDTLTRYRVIAVEAVLTKVTVSEEHASELAFGAATRDAVKDAMVAGEAVLLAPVMRLEITSPKDYTGAILQGLGTRRGQVESTDVRGQMQVIGARVPLGQMFGYTTELRSVSQGRASYSMQFDCFDQMD